MSNSSLVDYVKLSPNCSKPRKAQITKITIHHMAGNLSVEKCGDVFYPKSRQASANYGIGTDGRVGMYVEECNRAWTSSSSANDNCAITIEVANDGGAPDWHVSDAALAKTIDLCVDICKRNDIKKLNFTGTKDGNLTMHCYFAATACPGPYLKSKFQYIADEVNKRLGDFDSTPVVSYQVGDVIKLKPNATYTNGKPVPSWLYNTTLYYRGTNNEGIIFSTLKTGATTGVVKPEMLLDSPEIPAAPASYMVKVTVTNLNIRKGPGTSYAIVGAIKDCGKYTITEEQNGFGKLLSGAGWICLDYTKKC